MALRLRACGRKLKPNAEFGLKAPYAFARLFADDPAAVDRTIEIAERCNFSLDGDSLSLSLGKAARRHDFGAVAAPPSVPRRARTLRRAHS